MNRHRALRRIVSVSLILALPGFVTPSFAGTATASLTGRVLLASGRAPVRSGKVHVGNPRTGQIATATLSGEGTFTVSGLAPATYEVAIETAGVMNVASNAVQLAPGQNKAVQIAVDPILAQTESEGPPPEKKDNPKLGTLWNNPLTATAIVVVSAIVVGVAVDGLTDDDEEPASAD
jgi:hypothetical protein